MKVLTKDGYYLSGSPTQLIKHLSARVPVGRRDQGALLVQEGERIARYRREIGPAFARHAAQCLLKNLEEDGYLLICPP